MLFVLGLCLVAFLFAVRVMERLGVTGINVVGRVFGVVLTALAVQYIIDGATRSGELARKNTSVIPATRPQRATKPRAETPKLVSGLVETAWIT
jgi:hypothetical protein